MTTAKDRIESAIRQIQADIDMYAKKLADATTDEGRTYAQQQIDGCRAQLAKRQAMLAAELARN